MRLLIEEKSSCPLLIHLLAGLVRLLDVLHALVGDAGDVHVSPDGAPLLAVIVIVVAAAAADFTVCRCRCRRRSGSGSGSSRSALSSALTLFFLGRGRVALCCCRATVVFFGRRDL